MQNLHQQFSCPRSILLMTYKFFLHKHKQQKFNGDKDTSYDNIFSFLVYWSIRITSLLIFAMQIVHNANDIYHHVNLHCVCLVTIILSWFKISTFS